MRGKLPKRAELMDDAEEDVRADMTFPVLFQMCSDSLPFFRRRLSDQVQFTNFSFQISLPSIMVWNGVREYPKLCV